MGQSGAGHSELTLAMRYNEVKISLSSSVPKVADIWDIGLQENSDGFTTEKTCKPHTTGSKRQHGVRYGTMSSDNRGKFDGRLTRFLGMFCLLHSTGSVETEVSGAF